MTPRNCNSKGMGFVRAVCAGFGLALGACGSAPSVTPPDPAAVAGSELPGVEIPDEAAAALESAAPGALPEEIPSEVPAAAPEGGEAPAEEPPVAAAAPPETPTAAAAGADDGKPCFVKGRAPVKFRADASHKATPTGLFPAGTEIRCYELKAKWRRVSIADGSATGYLPENLVGWPAQ